MTNATNSDDVTGQYCTHCEMFIDHTTPIAVPGSNTGGSGCPECLGDTVAYVVVSEHEDERNVETVTGGYIPSGANTISLEAARGDA